jgi:ABC-type sugar transport system ATPase subunit
MPVPVDTALPNAAATNGAAAAAANGTVATAADRAAGSDTQAAPKRLAVAGLSIKLGPVGALTDVDLAVGAGELVVVTGEPGSGKTTLVRCIAGDLAPAAGEITLDGRRVSAGGSARKQGIAVVWQDLELCDNLDVAGALLLGQERRGLMLSPSRFYARAAALLARLDLPFANPTQPVSALTGGQRQLLAIAKAVIAKPSLLVLDEPTAPRA